MTEQQKKIVSRCNSIPLESLVKYILDGVISLNDLTSSGIKPEKVQGVKNALKTAETSMWNAAVSTNTAESFAKYMRNFPDGQFKAEADAKMRQLEADTWEKTMANLSEASLRSYGANFPDGAHIGECRSMLDDLPWLKAKEKNTIQAYNDYMAEYPGQHDREAEEAVNNLNDERDWNNACITGETFAYRDYVTQHPTGHFVEEAQRRIIANAGRDELLTALRDTPNLFRADEIQDKVYNNVASWDDVANVLGEEKANAIRDFIAPSPLPEGSPPDMLVDDSTEIYFWGTPSSGKTCALGSIVSSIQNKGIFEPLDCTGRHYMNILANIFSNSGVCVFPDSTGVENVQEMIMNIRDEHNKPHKVTLVDLAGELFRSVYFYRQNLFISEDRMNTLKTVLRYLKDQRNNKIHFFVVEYGAEDKRWDGLKMVNYLDEMISFLKKEKVFRKSTVGVYILVTKCDTIRCEKEDRARLAYEYVESHLPSFWNTLQVTCAQAGVKDVKVLSFSVGDVFAQNLCKFDGSDTDKIIRRIMDKTKPRGGFWDWLKK